MNIICFPHAGALLDPYRRLAKCLAGHSHLHTILPDRTLATPQSGRDFVADLLVRRGALFSRPHILFGHSAGGLLAIECAQQQGRLGKAVHLIIASSSGDESRAQALHAASDDALLAFIVKLGHTNGAILANDDARALLLHAMRHDLAVMSSFRRPVSLGIPVTEVWGADEEQVANAPYWGRLSAGHSHRIVRGDHFFPLNEPDAMADIIHGIALKQA